MLTERHVSMPATAIYTAARVGATASAAAPSAVSRTCRTAALPVAHVCSHAVCLVAAVVAVVVAVVAAAVVTGGGGGVARANPSPHSSRWLQDMLQYSWSAKRNANHYTRKKKNRNIVV